MSETEVVRDPLDVIADEAADVIGEREKMPWTDFIEMLQQRAAHAARRLEIAQRLQAAFAAEGGQLSLFPGVVAGVVAEPPKPRAKRRVLCHVIDAGDTGGCEGHEADVRFKCQKCGHETDWIRMPTASAAKRGIPCPNCNGPEAAGRGQT